MEMRKIKNSIIEFDIFAVLPQNQLSGEMEFPVFGTYDEAKRFAGISLCVFRMETDYETRKTRFVKIDK
jgi:hypothetical protein